MKIVIKPFLEKMMKNYFSDYKLINAKGIFYLFRKIEDENLYSYILFQREGKPYNQLVISECGIGYNKNWDGQPLNFIGKTNSLAYLISNNKPTSNIGWVKYGNTLEEINSCIEKLRTQIEVYVFPFFKDIIDDVRKKEIYKITVEVMQEELKKETPDDLEEIKNLMIDGMKADSKLNIYNYKNYNKWYNLINSKMENKVDYNRYILLYLKDYLNFYY